MQDSERPSILAVGMPEIFAIAEASEQTAFANDRGLQRDSARTSSGEAISNNIPDSTLSPARFLRGGHRTSAVDLFGPTAGLLKWMIYSAPNRPSAASPLESRLANQMPLATQSDSCDDSAFGVEFAGQNGSGSLSDAGSDHQASTDPASALVEGDNSADNAVSFIHAASAKQAIELLRVLRFDLMVTSDDLPDMAVSQLIARIRAVRPWQKWALVGSNITTQSEIAARTLGASAVFDAPADLQVISELAHSVASQSPARAAVGAGVSMSDDAAGGPGRAPKSRSGRPRRSNAKRSGTKD